MAFSWAFYCCDYDSDFTSNAFEAVCMMAIAVVALSGITTTQSSVRATHKKLLSELF
ncbi:hypothetical protein ABZN43_06560 [Campylobacter jejuni]|nr:hypothetical protein QMK15_00285 [Campylobacter jejuni]